jgi:cyclophilin family peptidyl-prolyl cis-trans isomerase
MKKINLILLFLVVIFLSGCGNKLNNSIKKEENMEKQTSYTAILHTSKGDIKIKLNETETPKTVENFVTLAKKDFYNGTIFHRVIKDFMIQGGCPEGTGTGDPGYKFDDESFTGEYTRGTVAMANAGPNTNGSQFFIMHADVALPKNYVIFGKVEDGLDVVDAIAESEVEASLMGESSKPAEPTIIESVEII